MPHIADIIYNPGAGKKRKKTRLVKEAADRLLERGWMVRMHQTERPGHATELARNATLQGVDVVFAMGGDGTSNEVAIGLLGSKTALGVLPQGTVNVFARETGIPKKPADAIDALLDGELHTMDAARLRFLDGSDTNHTFFFMAGVGYDGLVFNSVQKPGKRRKKSGRLLYYWEAFKQLKNADTPSATIIVDEQEFTTEHFSQMWVNNTQNVENIRLRDDSIPDDGQFAVTVFEGKHSSAKQNILSLGKDMMFKMMGRRRQSDQEVRLQGERLHLKLERPLFAEIDGEPIGSGKEIDIVVLKDALQVLTPKTSTIFSKPGTPLIPSTVH